MQRLQSFDKLSRYPVLSRAEMCLLGQQTPDFAFFIRPARFYAHPNLSTLNTLRVADNEFMRLAGFCGGTVVPHHCGYITAPKQFYEIWQRDTGYYRVPELPEKFILAALVQTIAPLSPVPEAHLDRLYEGMARYESNTPEGMPYVEESVYEDQFSFGRLHPEGDAGIIYHDIDPLWDD